MCSSDSDKFFSRSESNPKSLSSFSGVSSQSRKYHSSVPPLILHLSTEGIVQWVNPYFEQLTGWQLHELRGKEWPVAFPMAEEGAGGVERLGHGLDAKLMSGRISHVVTPGGEGREIHWHQEMMKDATGVVTGLLAIGEDVTHTVENAEETLRTSGRLKALLQALPALMFEVDQRGCILDCRIEQTKCFLSPSETVLGKLFSDFMPTAVADICFETLRQAAERGTAQGISCPLTLPDGTHWFEPSAVEMAQTKNSNRTFLFLMREVTPCAESLEQLEKRQGDYQWLVDNSPHCIFELDANGCFVCMNQAGLRMSGAPDEASIVGRGFLELVSEGDRPRAADALLLARRGAHAQLEFMCINGRWIRSNLTGLKGGGVVGLASDISGQRAVEDALRQSEARLKEAQEIAKIGSWELDIESGKLVWSEEVYRIFEFSTSQRNVEFLDFLEGVHPEDRELVKQIFAESVESKLPYSAEHRLLMSDGRVKNVQEIGKTEYDASGKPIRSFGTVQDITDRVRSRDRQKETFDRLHLVLDNITDGFFVLDEDWRYVEMNTVAAAFFGHKPERFLGTRFLREHHDLPGTKLEETCVEVMRTGKPASVKSFCEPLGKWFEIRVARFADGLSVFFSDITEAVQNEMENQRLRDALVHANRVGTLGELASGLAHELNQPLAAMHLDAGTALHYANESVSPDMKACLRRIAEQSWRAGEMVRRIGNFGRPQSFRREFRDINQLVHEVLGLIGEQLGRNSVKIELMLQEHLPAVHVDGIQIQQILVNLIRNAEESMADNSGIQRSVSLRSEASEGEIRVSISDSGCGLDSTVAENLFRPFQTTKSMGMGLGLAICNTIASAHGGDIQAYANADRGTTFVLTLPLGSETRSEAAWSDPQASRSSAKE